MVATSRRIKDDFSSDKLAVDVFCQTIAQRNYVNVQESADTWDTYTSDLCKAIVEAIAARTIAQQDYAKIQAEADGWERKLQLLALNSREDLVHQALLRRNACRDKARNLKVLLDKYSVQVSTLESQLAFWENQI